MIEDKKQSIVDPKPNNDKESSSIAAELTAQGSDSKPVQPI